MICPYCSNDSFVTNSRLTSHGQKVWRRRKCKHCGQIWSTLEISSLESTHRIMLDDSRLTPFSRDTLFISIYHALSYAQDPEKHRITIDNSSALTDTVIALILQKRSDAVIPINDLKRTCLEVLDNFDEVAGQLYKTRHHL